MSNRFEFGEKLGGGSYGAVYKAHDKCLNQMVAIKVIPNDGYNGNSYASVCREVSCSNTLREHPNIASIRHSFLISSGCGPATALVLDLMDQDLFSYISKGQLAPDTVKHLMRQLLMALKHCHQKRIMHRDLKPENILLDKDLNLKLTDFGMAYPIVEGQNLSTNVVTLYYRAPEILLGVQQYSEKIDMWAAGCVFAEMISSKVLFHGNDEIDQLRRIFSSLGVPTEENWPGIRQLPIRWSIFNSVATGPPNGNISRLGPVAMDLLIQLLTLFPDNRFTAEEALEHPFLA